MESLTTQVASLIVIISLNFLASLLIWLEYSDHKLRFLKFTALAQTFVLLWHLVSIVLVYDFGGALMQSMSALFFFLFVYFYLAIAVEKFPLAVVLNPIAVEEDPLAVEALPTAVE